MLRSLVFYSLLIISFSGNSKNNTIKENLNACEKGDAYACYSLELIYLDGEKAPKNYPEVNDFLDNPILSFSVSANGSEHEYSIPKTELKREIIDIAGRPLHFVEVYKDRAKGPKPLVIFIHGTPGGWTDQLGFLANEFLRENFHMIAVDRLGHNRSAGKIEPSLQIQAESFKPLLNRDTTKNGAILVGHSLGGPTIARTAMDYPEQVRALVFIASTGDPERSRRWYNKVGGIPPISWMLPRDLARSNREILPLKKQLKAMLPLWKTIKVPAVIIQGGKDKLVDPRNADFIQRALVNAEVNLVVRPEENHLIHWNQPQIVVDALGDLIN